MLHLSDHLGVHSRQLAKVKVLLVDELTQHGVLHPESEGLQAKLFLLNECVMLIEEPRNEEGWPFWCRVSSPTIWLVRRDHICQARLVPKCGLGLLEEVLSLASG